MDLVVAPPATTGAARLADGRRLGWAQWGPQDGSPVLFLSGAAMGSELGFGASVLDRLGVRLVAVDRPGLGRSDPDPTRTLTSWPADVRALATDLGLSRLRVVGFSQGGPFALACAAAGVGEAVAVVSGQDDLAARALRALLEPGVAALVDAVAADPAGVEADFARTADAEMMWRLAVETSSPTDRAIYTAASFAPAYRRSLAAGFAKGAAGYARDLVLALGPWPFDLGAVAVPVQLWFGTEDASPVHSPDRGATLAARIPTAERHVVPGAGGSLLWTHAEAILGALLAAPTDAA